MISKQVLMGIDCGTGGVRLGLYDIDGKEIVFATTEYKTTHEHTGWAEQNPLDWWNCLAQSTRKAIEKSGVSKEEIVSLSLDATSCSVVLSMNDGTPLRNSLIWMDVRASEEADFITKSGEFRAIMEGVAYGTENVLQSFRTCGYPVDEIYMGGGTTSSELFMQIHADVSNIAINVPENLQSSCLGSAILAAVTAGFYPSIQEAADKMVRFNKRVEPNFENHKK